MSGFGRLSAVLGCLALAAGGTLAADEPFDLNVELALPSVLTSGLEPGDTLQVSVRPEIQYGVRTAPGEPTVLEVRWTPGMQAAPLRFGKTVAPDMIYRLELRIIRADGKRSTNLRYLSALERLPRRTVDKELKLRLFPSHPNDQRDNLFLLVRDDDGLFRIMFFTA